MQLTTQSARLGSCASLAGNGSVLNQRFLPSRICGVPNASQPSSLTHLIRTFSSFFTHISYLIVACRLRLQPCRASAVAPARAITRVAASVAPPKGMTQPPVKPTVPPPKFGFVDNAERLNSRAAMVRACRRMYVCFAPLAGIKRPTVLFVFSSVSADRWQ
jgi:hypothetical protein